MLVRSIRADLLHHPDQFQTQSFGFAALAMMAANQRYQCFSKPGQAYGQAAFGQMACEHPGICPVKILCCP